MPTRAVTPVRMFVVSSMTIGSLSMVYSKLRSGSGAFVTGGVMVGCCGLTTGPEPTGFVPMTFLSESFGRRPVSI